MVERFNWSLSAAVATTYDVEKREEWEKYLPLALFAYQTAVHSSTGMMLMYGREPSSGFCTPIMGHEVNVFPAVLQSKLQDLAKTHVHWAVPVKKCTKGGGGVGGGVDENERLSRGWGGGCG